MCTCYQCRVQHVISDKKTQLYLPEVSHGRTIFGSTVKLTTGKYDEAVYNTLQVQLGGVAHAWLLRRQTFSHDLTLCFGAES